jgi:MFS family permease
MLPKSMPLSMHSRDFRLYMAGNFFSNIGIFIESVAASWLVYSVSGSGLYVGIMFFSGQAAIFLSSPVSGYLSDRFSRRQVLICANIFIAAMSLLLWHIASEPEGRLHFLFMIMFASGIARGIDSPSRTVFISDLVKERNHLINAISISSFLANLAKVIGPAMAAAVIPLAGEPSCFAISGASSAIFALLVAMINVRPLLSQVKPMFWSSLKEAAKYSGSYQPVAMVMLFIGLSGAMVFSLNLSIPVFCKDVLGGQANTYGIITAVSGIGSMAAALIMGRRRNALGLDMALLLAGVFYAFAFIGLSFSKNSYALAACMLVLGASQLVLFASANSILQTLVPHEKLGRVIGLYFMFFMACCMAGSIGVGRLTDIAGAPLSMQIVSLAYLGVCAYYAAKLFPTRRKSIRRYIDMGIGAAEIRSSLQRAGNRRQAAGA